MNSISQNPAALESDPDFDSDSTSLKSSAKNYVYENGRRYNGYKEGKYRWPNDETEQDRLDLHHHCFLMARRGELFACPLGQQSLPQSILDVGTGTEIWAMDIADRFPSAQVIGVDLSPIQPTWVPPNLTFEVDDIEEDWQYRDNSFDFIHVRSMAGAIYDWPKFYRQAFKALKPGGWIELQDYEEAFAVDGNSLAQDYILNRWAEFLVMAVEKASGKPFFNVASKHAKSLEDFGYVDVTEKIQKFPVGLWPKEKHEKELGLYWRQTIIDTLDTSGVFIIRILGWGKKETDEFLVDVKAALKKPQYDMYSKCFIAYGRKPV